MTNILLQAFASFLGTATFAVIFHVPKHRILLCGFIGSLGWVCYVLCVAQSSPAPAAFFSTMLVCTLSRFCSIRMRCPVTVFLVAGIFPLVPGAGIYWAAYYAITKQAALAEAKGLETLLIA
ncbi:MAG: threonine/serine exporter family protein, partial [Angelakisella sp.]